MTYKIGFWAVKYDCGRTDVLIYKGYGAINAASYYSKCWYCSDHGWEHFTILERWEELRGDL